MLRPKEYAELSPAAFGEGTYRRFCREQGLEPVDGGYGMLFCEDEAGERVTVLTSDIEYHRMLVAGSDVGVLGGLEVSAEVYTLRRDGWPDEW
jgi:hypothetical protein